MITMFIVAVGLLAMAQMLMTTMRQNLDTEIRMDAVVMAQSVMEAGATYITTDATLGLEALAKDFPPHSVRE